MENNNKNGNKKVNSYKTKNTTLVSFRLLNSDIEKLKIITGTTKIGKSQILRNLINGNPIELIEYNNESLEKKYDGIIKYLSNATNNLNQIAMKLNSNESIKEEDMILLRDMSKGFAAIQHTLNKRTTIKRKI